MVSVYNFFGFAQLKPACTGWASDITNPINKLMPSMVRRNILTPEQAQPLLDGAAQEIASLRSSP